MRTRSGLEWVFDSDVCLGYFSYARQGLILLRLSGPFFPYACQGRGQRAEGRGQRADGRWRWLMADAGERAGTWVVVAAPRRRAEEPVRID